MNELRNEFLAPPDEYSPIPFWFWNDELSEETLEKQLMDFYSKGIRSFVIHPRMGIPVHMPYLSDTFLDYVEFIVNRASELNMKVILYDEAMYPSGSACGGVVKSNPTYAAKGLKMTECPLNSELPVFNSDNLFVAALAIEHSDEGNVLSRVPFDSIDSVASFSVSNQNQWSVCFFSLVYSNGTIRGIHYGQDDGEPNAPKAADLLNPEAMQLFIQLTYEKYYRRLKRYYGNTIIAMFTDEPSIKGRHPDPGLIPWTNDFLPFYILNGGSIEDIYYLFKEETAESQEIRSRYQHAVNKKLSESYYEPISQWCITHHISLAGHPHSSEDIGFLKYFQLPCQDIVWRYIDPEKNNGIIGIHSTMGKCSSDSARHRGKRRNGNECFGACGKPDNPWEFTAADMKWYLDWLFVRGVNTIIPHAFYYSLRDQRVNERPPDVGPNNIWWPYYNQISQYIKRMCWLLTDSYNVTEIAVLCDENHLPWKPVQILYQNQIEFNYLEADLLDSLQVKDGHLKIYHQDYSVIIVDESLALTSKQKETIQSFVEHGVRVIYQTPADTLFDYLKVLHECNHTELKVDSYEENLRITHVCKENKHFYLLVNEGNTRISCKVSLPIIGYTEVWDAWNGTTTLICSDKELPITLDYRDSMIIAIDPFKKAVTEVPIHLVQTKIPFRLLNLKSEVALAFPYHTCKFVAELTLEEGDTLSCFVIENCAEVTALYINECFIGVKMWKPYSFDVNGFLHTGMNHISVETTCGITDCPYSETPILKYY